MGCSDVQETYRRLISTHKMDEELINPQIRNL